MAAVIGWFSLAYVKCLYVEIIEEAASCCGFASRMYKLL